MSEAGTIPGGDGRGQATVHVYEAGARAPMHPVRYSQALWKRRGLMLALAQSEIKAQSFNTVLGKLWLVLEPLMLAGVYTLLIGILRGQLFEPGRIQLIVSGMFLFTFTRISVQKGAASVIGSGGLLMNTSFPRVLLPTTAVLEGFLRLLPGLLIYAVIHVGTGLPIGAGLLAFPGLLALHALLNLGVAMLIATVTVYFRDVQTMLTHLMRIWLYTTPVLYPVTDLRGNLDTVLEILKWNPLFHLFDAYHQILAGGWPTPWQVVATGAWAAGALTVGFLIFVSKERALATRI